MTVADPIIRPFIPGTTGWTASDLDEPAIESKWANGAFEIVEGVLTTMPPAYYPAGRSFIKLIVLIENHLAQAQIPGGVSSEVEIVIDEQRVLRADGAFLTPQDLERQRVASRRAGKISPDKSRFYVPPTLIIESVSPGHETHDRLIKRRWYAEFRVPHYWILDAYAKRLECLLLEGSDYRIDAQGTANDELHPSLFPDLTIPLARIWPET
ncbi:MAG TPA: Uma2 family endonuclease [Tepidisphaeraceae bacterium]